MLDNLNGLDLTAKDIEMIESALHTQQKILSVQSQAGGTGAVQKLTEVKHLMNRIGRARPVAETPPGFSFSHAVRSLFCTEARCSQGN